MWRSLQRRGEELAARQGIAKGVLDHDFVPDTICDGLRGTLGALNFEILRNAGAQVRSSGRAAPHPSSAPWRSSTM